MTISRVGTDSYGNGSTSAAGTIDASAAAGDLIIAIGSTRAAGLTGPSGFSSFGSVINNGQAYISCFAKLSTGGDGGTTATVSNGTTNSLIALLVRRGKFGTLDSTIKGFTSNTTTTGAAVTGPALTNVPPNCWLTSAASCVAGGTGATCSVTGTNWSAGIPNNVRNSSFFIETADNNTDYGTCNQPTFTWSSGTSGAALVEFYLQELLGSPLFFGSN